MKVLLLLVLPVVSSMKQQGTPHPPPEPGMPTANELAAAQNQVNPVLASSNLLDSHDFFVCGSNVPGINGHYIMQPSEVVQSDPDTPVYFREDDDEEDSSQVALPDTATDVRLFRHNGFWMLADVGPWPPVTHFRCDPTKTHVIGLDVTELCGLGQITPPRIGYSPASPKLGDFPLTLQRDPCQLQIEASMSNFSDEL
ncbi:hypothetical protein P3T76_004754 [Phytophthora citrophthora]|uniref:Uncharacterized protein n=1 Tax=Phytophthora citrophthora TaxID=4793 RepID=A0AAD9LN16_9STRA|nr:hypothetical protein P3T76_004754 [Phytophthora citrophthora]